MASALDGITVLDMTRGLAGALATMFLCDHGARVIRIEPPGGDPDRQEPGYRVWDRGKESVFLDLSRAIPGQGLDGSSAGNEMAVDESRALFEKLVQKADLLIESYPPSSPYQALVDYNRLSATNPRLVQCSITAYGRRGPLKDEPANDDLVMARTGILATLPSFRPGPAHLVHPLPSVGAALLAVQGAVAALLAREMTGRGRKVETSLMSGVMASRHKAAGDKVRPPAKRQSLPTGDWPFNSVYECADGEWLQLSVIHAAHVQRTVGALGIQERVSGLNVSSPYAKPTEEEEARALGIVSDTLKTRPYREWAALLEEADVPYAPVRTIEEAMSDPQILFNEMVINLEDPEVGRMPQIGLPIKLLGTPGQVLAPAPTPGQHTRAVFSEVLGDQPMPCQVREAAGPDAVDLPPLSGVKVLAIDNVIAGPLASRLLADLGADVVKLEPPGGEISRPSSGPFSYFNCNKRSVAVNAKEPEGREIAQRLAQWADVILENMRPGAAGRIGLGLEELDRLNPSVVYTHITGFGSTGPYSHRPGLDPLAQAMTGLERAQAGPGNPPVYLGTAPVDYAGAMLGALSTVLALFARARTGVGQRAETCLLNGGILVGFMGLGRMGDKGQYGRHALSRLYETQEGWLYLVAESDPEWTSLCDVLCRPEFGRDPRFSSADARRKNDSALAQELAQVFREHAAEEWIPLLLDAGVPSAPVIDGYETGFFSDPQAAANEMFTVLEHATLGEVKFSKGLIGFPGTQDVAYTATPVVGEHNREVLAELGYSETQIEELYQNGIVKTEEASQD